MKILILANKLPYPPRDGGSIATLNMLTGLRDAGHEMTCLAMNTSKHPFPVDQIPSELSDSIRFIGIDCNTAIKPLRLFINLLFSREPYIASRFNLKSFRQALTSLLRADTFDIIQLEGPYTGHYLDVIHRESRAIVPLRAHNVEHLIWEQKAAHERSSLKRCYLLNMARRLKRFEHSIARGTDCLVPISEEDAAVFSAAGLNSAIQSIPAGLQIDHYPLTPLPPEPSLFFIGALDWLPNQEGLDWFLDKVFPLLVEQLPGLEFHLAGRNAPAHFSAKLVHPRITYHGEVEDARAFMQSYRVMVAPLLSGSGIRIKILEGMALGRPVITTSAGIAGINATHQENVLISDDPKTFASLLIQLLLEQEPAERIAADARSLVSRNFDTFELSTRLSRFFNTQV